MQTKVFKCNTLLSTLRKKTKYTLSNISTTPKSSNLLFQSILNYYLDADTVPVEDYLHDKGSVTGERSDILTA